MLASIQRGNNLKPSTQTGQTAALLLLLTPLPANTASAGLVVGSDGARCAEGAASVNALYPCIPMAVSVDPGDRVRMILSIARWILPGRGFSAGSHSKTVA